MLIDELLLLAPYWPFLLAGATLVWLLKNKYGNGLNKYPGPSLAGYTNYWRFLDALGRSPERTHIHLHRKHGDIVRLGPKVLSFADPKAVKTIYGLNKGFVKVGGPQLVICSRSSGMGLQLTTMDSQISIRSRMRSPRATDCSPFSRRRTKITTRGIDAVSTTHSQCLPWSRMSH